MEYKICVNGSLRAWQVVGDKAEEIGPLGPGEYRFLQINSPVPKTIGYWLVLKDKYDTGAIVGRHVMSTGDRFRQEEGFSIEEVVTVCRNSRP